MKSRSEAEKSQLITEGGKKKSKISCIDSKCPHHPSSKVGSSVPRDPEPTMSPSGENESRSVSTCLPQLCEMLPKGPVSFSPSQDAAGVLHHWVGQGGEGQQ